MDSSSGSLSSRAHEESRSCGRCVAAAANRMSCCGAAASREPLDGIRKEEEEEESRRKMDVSLLREQYRSSREKQRSLTQVLLFRADLEEPTEAVRIVPVAQGLASPWEPNSPPPSFDSEQKMYDPWHVHLDLHRRSRPAVSTQFPPSRLSWSSSSDVGGFQQESRSRKASSSVSLCSSRETSPCGSLAREEDELHPVFESPDRSSGRSSKRPPSEDPTEMSAQSSVSSFQGPDDCSTCSPSTTSLHLDQNQNPSSERRASQVWRGSRFNRQLSVGGVSSSSSSQNHFPFPNRKSPKISEAARRLGMYSSF